MARTPVLAAAAGATVAALAAAVLLRRRRRTETPSGPPVPAPGSPPDATSASDRIHASFTCACGQELRMTGEGRHTLFWSPDAPVAEPLLEDACPSCGRALVEQTTATTS